ncbi:MAG TPA: carbohydrate ABC transporter permease [Caldilineae bacterium]|nr:carbohydrate ABC transporter permease [Caldilineae bacterium]
MPTTTTERPITRMVTRPRISIRLGQALEHAVLYLGLLLFSLIFFFPFYWVITASVKKSSELLRVPPTLWPRSFTLEHHIGVWTPQFARYFLNTFIYAGGTTIIVLFTSTLVGFVLVKHRSRFGDLLFYGIVATMTVPFATYIIPLHGLLLRIERTFHIPMLNTYWGMILPWVFYPFGIFLMRQAMFGIPDDLIDAARIDGAGLLSTYWRVVLPLVRSSLAAMVVFVFIFKYDDLLWPLVVATESRMYPLTLGLVEFIGVYFVEYGLFTAASVAAIMPIIILYIFVQRFIVQGVALTGLKG